MSLFLAHCRLEFPTSVRKVIGSIPVGTQIFYLSHACDMMITLFLISLSISSIHIDKFKRICLKKRATHRGYKTHHMLIVYTIINRLHNFDTTMQ